MASLALAVVAPVVAIFLGCGRPSNSGTEVVIQGISNSNESTSDAESHFPLVRSPAGPIQFGSISRGGTADRVIWLTNPADAKVDIAEIRTTCECLRVLLPCRSIGPDEKVAATLRCDFRSDPDYAGILAMNADAVTRDGTVAFDVKVNIEVRKE